MAENMENVPKGFLGKEKVAPTLANWKKNNPFTVPPRYFEELEKKTHYSIWLSTFKKEENCGLTVPENYFSALTTHINAQVSLEEFKPASTGFNTPTDYFENLQQQIASRTTGYQRPKTIPLWKKRFFKYGVAASLTLITGFGLYIYQQQITKTHHTELAQEQLLYDIEENIIIEYIQEQNTKTANLSEAEMETYILNNISTNELFENL